MNKVVLFAVSICAVSLSAAATTVSVSDTPVTKDVIPIGCNFGGQSYYSPPLLKVAYHENFEGTDYRQCHSGWLEKDGFTTEYISKATTGKEWWGKLGLGSNFYPGAKVTVLSGSAKGQTAVIKEITFADYDRYGKGAEPFMKFVFETPIDFSGTAGKEGVLIEQNRRNEGCTGQIPGYWMNANCSLTNDTATDNFGKSSLLLDATSGEAFYRTPTIWQKYLDNNGKWFVRFKAKAADSKAKLVVKADGTSGSKPVDLSDEWKDYTLEMDISGYKASGGDRNSMVCFVFSASGGKVLIDDITNRKDEPFKNKSAFRDDFVESMRALHPGILRNLMMGGAMRDYLESPLRSCRVANSIVDAVGPVSLRHPADFSAGEMFGLAEELGTEAWFGIPGTLYPEEMDLFMEYIGGPVTTEGGKIRAAQGHPEPWTKTLKKIYVEPGNEAWNTMFGFLAGGYNGPDYWQDLFSRVKKSPYYSPNVICMAAGQNYAADMSKKILADTPAADCYAIAPYQVHSINAKAFTNNWPEKQDFYRWALAYPFYNLKKNMPNQYSVSKATGKEFAVYECNWHMTGGNIDKNNPLVLEYVNSFLGSVPAAIGNFNHMLTMMRDFNVRSQCFFTFSQENYNGIKLWGAVLNYKEGEERQRPNGLALGMINQAVFGDMVKAEVSGSPMFSATGPDITGARSAVGTAQNPAVTAYAFKDDKRHSLVLFNMDLTAEQPVELKIPAGGKAKTILLAPAKFDDNNEFESGEPAVSVKDGEIADLGSDTVIKLPPASIMTVIW